VAGRYVAVSEVKRQKLTGVGRYVVVTEISGFNSSSTPGVFYINFYNHARRLRLEKLLYMYIYIYTYSIELSRSSNGYLNHFWIQVVVSEVKRPLRNRFRIETVTNL
jgi:hypothetical protein